MIGEGQQPPGVESIPITSRGQWLALRARDVTASAAAALFGEHEFTTAYGLWALKSGKKEDEEAAPGGPMERGELLEPVAVELLRRRRPTWTLRYPVQRYFRETASRIGATPDILAIDPSRPGFGVVQTKSVEAHIFGKKWVKEDGIIEPPFWIAVQAGIEASLTGASWAVVAPIVVSYGIDLPIVEAPIHAGIMDRLREESRDFWLRVKEGDPPDPDFGRDAALIAKLAGEPDGSEIDLSSDNRLVEILALREKLKERERDGNDAVKDRKALDAEIIHKLGSASRARAATGQLVEVKQVHKGAYSVKETSYPQVSVKGLLNL